MSGTSIRPAAAPPHQPAPAAGYFIGTFKGVIHAWASAVALIGWYDFSGIDWIEGLQTALLFLGLAVISYPVVIACSFPLPIAACWLGRRFPRYSREIVLSLSVGPFVALWVVIVWNLDIGDMPGFETVDGLLVVYLLPCLPAIAGGYIAGQTFWRYAFTHHVT